MTAAEEGPKSSLVLYQTEDGRTRIQCRFEDETLWLTQALIAELHITIKDKPWDFFDFTDLLDFPGARSRERIPAVRKFLQRERSLEGLFLRGKVGYLFDRYCAEQELTSMLLCIGPSNQEVRTLPKMVDDWIGSTHGATLYASAQHVSRRAISTTGRRVATRG